MNSIKQLLYKGLRFLGLERKRPALPIFLYNIYSQNGEDGVVEFLLKKIPDVPPYVIDIGANDGIKHSNSRLLLVRYGFSGLLIEPFHAMYKKLQTLYAENTRVKLSRQAVGDKTTDEGVIHWHGHFTNMPARLMHINKLLDALETPGEIGFLSIDTDGSDNSILRVLNWSQYRPYFVIAEIDSSSADNLQEQITIMDTAGYLPLLHIGNVLYYRKDLSGKLLLNWGARSRIYGLFRK